MIIARSPLRITFGGGGTDLPSYYREHGGFLVAAAIDKFVYITLNETFEKQLIVKYSRVERVESLHELEHPIFREALRFTGVTNANLEITSLADIPAGTGLGSSGSFTTALLKALHTYRRSLVLPSELASQACHLEIDLLKEPVGKQDPYIAAYGGITGFYFNPDDTVTAQAVKISEETQFNLEDHLMLFFTGLTRKSGGVLKDQDRRSREGDAGMIENLHQVKAMGLESCRALQQGDLEAFARQMSEQWEQKKRRSAGMSNNRIDEWFRLARANGALGGKLIGAGGGGFFMFFAEEKRRLRHALTEAGLTEVRIRFDFEGTRVLVQ